MEESNSGVVAITHDTAADQPGEVKEIWAIVVDAFHQGEGLRNIYAAFGPFEFRELDEAEEQLRTFGEEVQNYGPLLWEDRSPAVDPGLTRVRLYDTIPVIER